jgi:hypothetical protein
VAVQPDRDLLRLSFGGALHAPSVIFIV